MSSEATDKQERNPRGIPRAPFIVRAQQHSVRPTLMEQSSGRCRRIFGYGEEPGDASLLMNLFPRKMKGKMFQATEVLVASRAMGRGVVAENIRSRSTKALRSTRSRLRPCEVRYFGGKDVLHMRVHLTRQMCDSALDNMVLCVTTWLAGSMQV